MSHRFGTENLFCSIFFCRCGSKETLLTALAGVLGPLGGFLQKLVFFHFFHDNFKISAATCWLLVLCIYIAIVLCDDSSSDVTGRFVEEPHGNNLFFQDIQFEIVLYFFLQVNRILRIKSAFFLDASYFWLWQENLKTKYPSGPMNLRGIALR